MDEVSYHRTCPICGVSLSVNADGPWTPPWRCDPCRQSWWVSELTQEARACFRREQCDFGWGGTKGEKAVRQAVRVECEQAAVRGVSLRREQLGLVSGEILTGLLARHPKILPAFGQQMTMQVR